MCPEAYGLSGACRMATGQYTGDGTLAQAIVGIGFRPRYVAVFRHLLAEAGQNAFLKIDQMAGDLSIRYSNDTLYDNRLISLDADGFTVDDDGANSDPNILNQLYDFVAFG